MTVNTRKIFKDETEDNILHIEIEGEDTEWHWKHMSWAERTSCLSKALVVVPGANGEGSLSVDLAKYYIEALAKMVFRAPVPITVASLNLLSEEVGEALQGIVPLPFGSPKTDATLKKE